MMFLNKFKNDFEESPLIITSPHSGTIYPQSFLENLESDISYCKSIEDMFVDELIENNEYIDSIVFHKAYLSRAVIDLNRKHSELDISQIKGKLNFETENTRYVRSGIGLIPTNTPLGKLKYKKILSSETIANLINEYYFPWHKELQKLIKYKLEKFGRAFILDCHSMPSIDIPSKVSLNLKDIVLGNCKGISCSKENINFVKDLFIENKFSVELNNPYSGGFITQNYHDISQNIETLQIEIRRDLYMDELSFRKNHNFEKIKENLFEIINSFNLKLINDYDSKVMLAAQ